MMADELLARKAELIKEMKIIDEEIEKQNLNLIIPLVNEIKEKIAQLKELGIRPIVCVDSYEGECEDISFNSRTKEIIFS